MNRFRASLILLALCAAIYLPGLGSTEIKGEEGRRILPAVTMLETGNWLVPYVGGKPFLRKPPLINWAIAVSFKLTGVRNEWTARLPSALAVLAMGMTIVALGSGRGWMSAETALVAAIMAITSFGLLAKARFAGAEIEGLYVALAGIATVCWMAWWTQARSPLLVWVVPWIFLGLALLAKGPLHLLFFYAIVLAVIWKARAWREMFHPAHLAGIVLMTAIFAAWAIPYFKSEAANKAGKVWKDQLANRVTENVFDWKSYASNLPRGLLDNLPWLCFAPLVFAAHRQRDEVLPRNSSDPPNNSATMAPGEPGESSRRNDFGRLRALERGALLATAGCFTALLLVPGVLPRYLLPLSIPWALLVALAIQGSRAPQAQRLWDRINRGAALLLIPVAVIAPVYAGAHLLQRVGADLAAPRAFDWPHALLASLAATLALAVVAIVHARRAVALRAEHLAITSAALLAGWIAIYAVAVAPSMRAREHLRPLAQAIDAAVPAGQELVLYDPGFLPVIFYLRTPCRYAPHLEDIPPDADFVLARGAHRRKLAEKRSDFVVMRTFTTKGERELLLLQRWVMVREDARPHPGK